MNDSEIEPICSFYLNNNNNRKAAFTLGGFDIEQFSAKGSGEEDIFWADLLENKYYWTVGMSEFKVENEPL